MNSLDDEAIFPKDCWKQNDILTAKQISWIKTKINELITGIDNFGLTYAVQVIYKGRQVFKWLGDYRIVNFGEKKPIDESTEFCSWSIAKSVLSAVVGIMSKKGIISPSTKLNFSSYPPDDKRREITIEHLLTMTDGLDFKEDYENIESSDVVAMLFGEGASDIAGFMLKKELKYPPGSVFNYSSGSSNLLSYFLSCQFETPKEFIRFIKTELFQKIGAKSFKLGLDEKGIWIASSYLYGTIDDFSRFGYLYLRNGQWGNTQILPENWVSYTTKARHLDPTNNCLYGAGWWYLDDGLGTFYAAGFEGQLILVTPILDLVIVRLGRSSIEQEPAVLEFFKRFIGEINQILL